MSITTFEVVTVQLGDDLAREIDSVAASLDVSRSQAARFLIDLALVSLSRARAEAGA